MPPIQQIVRGLKAYYTLPVAFVGQLSDNALTRRLFHTMIDKLSLILFYLKCMYTFVLISLKNTYNYF